MRRPLLVWLTLAIVAVGLWLALGNGSAWRLLAIVAGSVLVARGLTRRPQARVAAVRPPAPVRVPAACTRARPLAPVPVRPLRDVRCNQTRRPRQSRTRRRARW